MPIPKAEDSHTKSTLPCSDTHTRSLSLLLPMCTAMASFSAPTHFSATPSPHSKPHLLHKPFITLRPNKNPFVLLSPLKASAVTAVEPPPPEQAITPAPEKHKGSLGGNGSVAAVATTEAEVKVVTAFEDPRWVGGTWDLTQFQKNGSTDWDAVIDAGEVINLL